MNFFGLFLVLFSPFFLGLPWVRIGKAKSIVTKLCFAYIAGYFVRLVLFHWISMPMTVLGLRFSTMSRVFSVLLIVICLVCVWLGKSVIPMKLEKVELTVNEMIYGILFLGLLLIQLYLTIRMDPTVMTYDDATYTVYSSDALATDYMFIANPATGVFQKLDKRFLQSSLLFSAYIVHMTGMQITMVERTFSYALNLALAYGCYVYMAEDLYEERENRLIFLILISIIYIFGYHSHYSMTFRLLGPNSQGKAILAVTLVPFLFVLFRKHLESDFDRRFALFLLLLSDAACALSLMGTGYMVAIVGIVVIMSLSGKERQWKRLLYIPYGCIMPCIYAGIYLFMKYFMAG